MISLLFILHFSHYHIKQKFSYLVEWFSNKQIISTFAVIEMSFFSVEKDKYIRYTNLNFEEMNDSVNFLLSVSAKQLIGRS